jgi:hypothetical protein
MSKEKEYTKEDVISILDFSKGKDIASKNILSNWLKDKNNRIENKDEHGLSVVGIFEHPIFIKDKEVGKIIIFNYTGVGGGGWERDIFKMVQSKYFSNERHFTFMSDDIDSISHRFFLTGDIFEDENFYEWERPKSKDDFRVFKQELPKSELIITYDVSDERIGSEINSSLRSNKDYYMYYDESACRYYIKNIHYLEYKPSRPIIEERIKSRTRDKKLKEVLNK